MELTYKNNKLKKLCEDSSYNSELKEKYGKDVSIKLPQRIIELKAFDSVFQIPVTPPYRRHKLKGKRKDEFAIDITRQYRLIFKNNENNILIDDLKNIKKIIIMEVSKHYE